MIVCPDCGGELTFERVVNGTTSFPISNEGKVDFEDKDFDGDFEENVGCRECGKYFNFNYEGDVIIIIDEDEDEEE